MRMFVRLVLGLLVLEAAAARPRFSRQADPDNYDDTNYDEDLNNVETDNEEFYDYGNELTTGKPEIGPVPPDYEYRVEIEEEEPERPSKPHHTPQGSGGSGVLMSPDPDKEVEPRHTSVDIPHVTGDSGSSSGSGVSGASEASGVSGSAASGDTLMSGDVIFVSGASGTLLSSGSSGELFLTDRTITSGDIPTIEYESSSSGASGEFTSGGSGVVVEMLLGSGESGDQSGSGFPLELLSSGGSGSSGVSGDFGESGETSVTFTSGEEELTLVSKTIPQEASGASGEPSGASGVSELSGDVTSADGQISGASGVSGVSASGDDEIIVTLTPGEKEVETLLPTTEETLIEGTPSIEETDSSGESEISVPTEPDEPLGRRPGMPTCLLCTCLGTSVYCDDLKLSTVPPLPKETTHFYARYNRITKISKSDFAFMNKLKRIDLTANEITSIDDKALVGLPELEELVVRENHITQLPALPETMTLIDASHNKISSKTIHKEAFKDMTGLQFLYLTDNNIDYIPVPLPDSLRSLHLQRNNIQMMHEDTFCNLNDFNYIRNALEDIRLDGNPVNLSKTPQAYICLPRIPIGNLI